MGNVRGQKDIEQVADVYRGRVASLTTVTESTGEESWQGQQLRYWLQYSRGVLAALLWVLGKRTVAELDRISEEEEEVY